MHMQDHNRSKAVAGLEFCNSTPESLRFRGHSQSIAISNPPPPPTIDMLGLASYDATSGSLRLRGPVLIAKFTCWAWHLAMPHRRLFDSEAKYR